MYFLPCRNERISTRISCCASRIPRHCVCHDAWMLHQYASVPSSARRTAYPFFRTTTVSVTMHWSGMGIEQCFSTLYSYRCRCGQPLVGIQGRRSEADENMIVAARNCSGSGDELYIFDARSNLAAGGNKLMVSIR